MSVKLEKEAVLTVENELTLGEVLLTLVETQHRFCNASSCPGVMQVYNTV